MKYTILSTLVLLCASTLGTAQTTDQTQIAPKRRLGVVGTAHLDTQWRWTIKESINEYIPKTFLENEKLFKKFPNYVFSFEGSFRYQILKEYYPDYYARLKQYIADGRWKVTGSWVDAVDVNIPSFESLVRHTLYGNGFYKQEFGKSSRDIFLPDCFGFGYALPSIAHHCGLRSFSTQKLSWGSSVERPFDIGLWRGVDGSTVIAAINPGSYGSQFRGDLSRDTAWLRKIDKQNEISGLPLGFAYFGTGDQGGSPDSLSVEWLEKSMKSDGPIEVHSIGADEVIDMVGKDSSKLPVFDGELLLTRHGVGCYTSQAAMKRWNRKNELLADATERACVIASVFAGAKYPGEELKKTWERFLWHQFHDDLTGTSIPEAYEYSWNDELLCQNRFASMLTDAVTNIAPMLDTRTKGLPLIVYNPVSTSRQEVMTVDIPANAKTAKVVGPDGKESPSRIIQSNGSAKLSFVASAPSVGYAVYDLQTDVAPAKVIDKFKVSDRMIENDYYVVTVDNNGDVWSILDKKAGHEMLGAPIHYQFLFNKPKQWPAWEIQYEDLQLSPQIRFVGSPEFTIIDQRPVRVGLQIDRKTEKSKFKLIIWLAAGEAGNKVEFENVIDWYERETLLKAAFHFSFPNDSVTYDLGLGTIKRGLNTPKKYEVPGQQWADLTNQSGNYGVAILNDCKYGWDHPDAQTVRLSLIHTPGVFESWNWVGDQSSMDNGHHEFRFALVGHSGDWRDGNVVVEAAKFNQPLMGFYAPKQSDGKLGKSLSFASVQSRTKKAQAPSAMISALKKAETSDDIVVRLRETAGKNVEGASVNFALPATTATEVNGQEESIGSPLAIKGPMMASFTSYQPRAYSIKLSPSKLKAPDKPKYQPLKLDYNLDGISMDDNKTDGDLDGHGNTLAGELLPDTVWFQGIPFVIGPKGAGLANVVRCEEQSIRNLDANGILLETNGIYLLVMTSDGGAVYDFYAPHEVFSASIPSCFESVGQWNNRMINGKMSEDPSQITPAYASSRPVSWYGSHYHTASGSNSIYKYSFTYLVEIPQNPSVKLPNDPRLRVLAATAVTDKPSSVTPAQPLYDIASAAIARISVDRTAFVDSAVVSLSSPNVGAELRYSLDGTAPTKQSAQYEHPFAVTDSRMVRARAFVPGVEGEYVSSLSVQKLLPHPAVSVANTLPGLSCKYYEGNWDKLPNFDTLKVLKDTITDTIAVPIYAADSLYGLVMGGYITVPSEGMYEFGLSSDDGSKLWIGDSLVVDNDGLHGSGELPGQIALKAGTHPITLKMFQCKGDEALDLWITGPGLAKQIVPHTMLSRDLPAKKKGKR